MQYEQVNQPRGGGGVEISRHKNSQGCKPEFKHINALKWNMCNSRFFKIYTDPVMEAVGIHQYTLSRIIGFLMNVCKTRLKLAISTMVVNMLFL